MDDPVKGEGRMITDANGITRREGGISGIWGNMFNDSNGVKADSPPLIPDIRDILDVFPQSLRESLVNKISDAIDYEPVIGVMGKTGAGKSSVCNALFQGEVCAVSDVEACTREAQELCIRFGCLWRNYDVIYPAGDPFNICHDAILAYNKKDKNNTFSILNSNNGHG